MALQTYYARYEELQEQYKIAHSSTQVGADECDVVVECIGTGYAHKKYRVVKNEPGLSTQDLAIICDNGNLCFGYRTEGSIICVHTD